MFGKRKVKHVIAMLLCVCMVTQSVPVTAYAAESETQAAGEYSEDESVAPESSALECETEAESSALESETESSALESETESSTLESEITEESSAPESEAVPEETSLEETEAVTEENSTEETETVSEEASVEETETQMEEEMKLKSICSETTLTLGEIEVELNGIAKNDCYGFVFKAPEDGQYAFYISSAEQCVGELKIYKSKTDGSYTDYEGKLNLNGKKEIHEMSMKKGEVRYFALRTAPKETFRIGVSRIPSVSSLTRTATGYRAETNLFTAEINIDTGYSQICFATKLTAKSGVELPAKYGVKLCARPDNHAKIKYLSDELATNKAFYQNRYITDLSMNTAYTLSMYLYDYDTDEILYTLISENDNVKRTTLATNKEFVIRGGVVDYGSITLQYEKINQKNSYYMTYAPKNNPSAETWRQVYYDHSDTIDGLNDETEYVFTVYNDTGVKVDEKTIKTAKYPLEPSFTVDVLGPDKISLSAKTSQDVGRETDAQVYWHYKVEDADGNVVANSNEKGTKTDAGYTFASKTIDFLEAAKKYKVTLYLTESGSGNSHFREKTVEVTTDNAPIKRDDVTFTLTQDPNDVTKVKYKVEIKNNTQPVQASIRWKEKDKDGSFGTSICPTITNGFTSGASSLQKGVTYQFRLSVAGLVFIKEYTAGTAEYIAELSDDTDAYDSTLTLKLKKADGSQLDAGTKCSVDLIFNEVGNPYVMQKGELSSANNFSITGKTSDVRNLLPDTTYQFIWKITLTSGSNETNLKYYQTIRTKKSTIKTDINKVYIDCVDFSMALGGRTENISKFTYLYIYLKEGNSSYRFLGNNQQAFKRDNGYKLENCRIPNLKPGTKYTVSMRNSDGLEYGTFQFETLADDKKITVTEIEENLYNVLMHFEISGNNYAKSTEYATLKYRPKGTNDEWETRSDYIFSSNPTHTYTIDEYFGDKLKEDITYEYILGIQNPKLQNGELQSSVQGTFRLMKDERKLQDIKITTGYDNAEIRAELVGNTKNNYTSVTVFYRESGTEDWVRHNSSRTEYDTSFVVSREISGLKQGTKYDYALVIGDSNAVYTDPDLFPASRRYTGSFETKKLEIPQSLTLSAQELKLNLGYVETAELKVTPTPATAAADVDWTSSDEAVVKVKVDGTVTAAGRGEAVITAASKYDANIKATCKVSVKSYVVARKEGTQIQPVYDAVTAYKGYTIGNIGLYEQSADDKYTEMSDFTVVSQNPSIADWEDNSIKAKSVGSTDMTFDKDGYKATIGVSVNKNENAAFFITGLRASNKSYPAIRRGEDQYELAYHEKLKLNYQAEGLISPDVKKFATSDFIWESTDTTVAEVSASGVITPKKAGTVKVTVKPKQNVEACFDPEKSTVELTLSIKPTPTNSVPEVYAVTNEKPNMKLADVTFPAEWGEGWEWKEPQTLLYSLPVHSAAYAFDAVYTGDTYYAYEGTVNVYISTITGVSISEPAGNHRNVVMVSEDDKKDTLSLQISPSCYGKIDASKYTVKLPDVRNLTITKNEKTGCYDITAGKKGTYTIKPQILIGDKVVATGSYKFKAVSANQIESILLTTDSKEGAVINGNMISFDASAETTAGSSFMLQAEATDREGQANTTTKLAWSITDKSVATIRLSADTRTATVTVKGSGHAVIQVTAKDEAAVSAQWKLEIQDHRPRVSVNKVTVNTAYDYDSNAGRKLAFEQKGSIEIVPVYGESINSVRIIHAQTNETDTSLGIVKYSDHDWVVKPLTADMSTNKAYQCRLEVTTGAGTYTYPLAVSIINKMPKVTAKITKGVNLFYIADEGEVEITLESTLFSISSLKWEDAAMDNGTNAFERGNLFIYVARPHNKKYCRIKQDKVRVANGALVDAGVDQVTMTLKLSGVREEYKIPIKIKTTYQKPTLKIKDIVTGKNVSNMIPSVSGGNVMHFSVYDNLLKSTLYYTNKDTRSKNYYDQISCDSDRISLSPYDYFGMTAVYSGTGKQETVNYTIGSAYWREPLSASHTIKAITPKAVLSRNNLTFNTNYANSDTVSIDMDNYSDGLKLTDVEIKGANAKAQALLDDNKLEIVHAGTELQIKLSKLQYMDGDVPAGKYTYNLVPYYTNAQTGEKTALNTLKLAINLTNKAITVKASTKGSIDLSQSNNNSLGTNRIAVTAKFANVGSDFEVTGARLTGEYSKYFSIRKYVNTSGNPIYYIKINSSQKGKLKAGQNYKLRVVYTVQMSGGESIEVTSNVLNVKPKQTAPKITVAKNGQTLYVASNLTRTYTISVPNSSYGITDASGSIDVNKDGMADITVTTNSISDQSANLTVQITDQDAVLATANGKTYSIPVTVKVLGRDGIAKDASAVINVKVKR